MSEDDSKEDKSLWNVPLEDKPPKIKPPKETAGGWGALRGTIKHAKKQMGTVRALNTLARLNQKEGFDCPGCAWPEPENHRSHFEYCENGAKAVAEEATKKRITAKFFAEHSIEALASKSDHWLSQQGRLTQPMYLRPGNRYYEPITWDKAFHVVAEKLNALYSPNEALFYTSGRTSNEAAFLYQLFVRLFGTNNLPDCSNMCHESSGVGLSETIGVGKGTVTLDDFDLADCIVVIGQNPGTNHPRMLTALQKAARNDCKIITINPLPEAGNTKFVHPQDPWGMMTGGTSLSTLFLQVRINGDVALLKGLQKHLLKQNALDPAFIEQHTSGFEDHRKDLDATDWESIERSSGIGQKRIEQAGEILANSKRLIVCWAMGLTQHENAVDNIQQIVNLLLLGGHLGRPGAGVCPVRGHSNVQGDRTMGIWERPSDAFLNQLSHTFKFSPPREHGYDSVHSIKAMHEGKAKVFFAMGGNFLSASPDTEFTAEALRKCDLTAHVSTKLNRSHLVTGASALILPCRGRTERDEQQSGPQYVTVENSMGVVHRSRGQLKPASSQLKSEVSIVAGLARATFRDDSRKMERVDWTACENNYDLVRDFIEQVIPGFENFNERVRDGNGFSLPNPVRDELKFNTDNGKANFTVHHIPAEGLEAGQFMMMTVRTHDQYNTTIYGLDDRYRGIHGGRRVVLINPDEAAELNFKEGTPVDITSHFRGETRTAEKFFIVPYPIPKRSLATYFPEANVLVPVDSFARKSHTPTSKSFVVTLKAHGNPT